MKKDKMNYESIIRKINYWKNYDGTGDEYRKNNDLDCILTGGNLLADTIVSLWLPLRYTLNYFECQKWTEWKEYEVEVLRAKRMGLKDCNEFLEDLIANIEIYLPDHAISRKLSELFDIGQSKSNVMLLPYRKWNTMRGSKPYWDYMPHFLFDLMNTEDSECLRAIRKWIEKENLEIFFENAILDINHIKDLAGTGNVCSHLPRDISVQVLIKNYTDVLRKRERLLEKVA